MTLAKAFGLAGSQAAGTFAAWGTPTVKFHQCRGALSGLMAALLAQQKFDATREFLTAPDGGLYNSYANGGRPEAVTAELGKRWELQQIALRLWPSASSIQGMITALFELVHGGFAAYKAKFEALLSAHYVAAAILHDRALTLSQFEPARYNDPTLRRFASEQVEVRADPGLSGVAAIAEIETVDGATLSSRCEQPRGAPENPLSRAEIEDKFRTYARARLPAGRVEEIVGTVARLESLGSVRTLMASLRERPRRAPRSTETARRKSA